MKQQRKFKLVNIFNNFRPVLAATVLLGGLLPYTRPALGETTLQCEVVIEDGSDISNRASLSYNASDDLAITGISNQVANGTLLQNSAVNTNFQGIIDSAGNTVISLGLLIDALNEELQELGFSEEEGNEASIAAIEAFVALDANTPQASVSDTVKTAIEQAIPERGDLLEQADDSSILLALTGMSQLSLLSIGLSDTEGETGSQAALETINSTAEDNPFNQTIENANQAVIDTLTTQSSLISQIQEGLSTELSNLRAGNESSIQSGDELFFRFLLENRGVTSAELEIPNAQTIQNTGLTGAGSVTGVEYSTNTIQGDATQNPAAVTLPPGEELELLVAVEVGTLAEEETTAINIGLSGGCGGTGGQQSLAILPPLDIEEPLVDPLGQITGCAGEILADYRGFSISIFNPDPNDSTGGVSGLTSLTATEVPDQPGNNIPEGLPPNSENSNPFFLTNADQGQYNFLLDVERGQLDQGSTYILVVSPPEDSIFSERRIRIVIGDRTEDTISFVATSLDGRPISTTDGRTSVEGTIGVDDIETVGVSLSVLDLDASVCQPQDISIVKSGDRSAAEPGDTVLYRLSIRSLSTAPLNNLVVRDVLPQGFRFEDRALNAELAGELVPITASQDGRVITFTVEAEMTQGQVLNIVYAAQLTPDSVRGSGENSATVRGRRTDNNFRVQDGPATHRLRIRPGILADCGTMIGRVFVDKNFDGEQQRGEPGVPNAVIFLEDGNRITTDADGLFSVIQVLPGYHTGVLDLTSVPGYTLAPNLYFSERNSQSRLVHLAPGGLVRMNFAVTPTFREEDQ